MRSIRLRVLLMVTALALVGVSVTAWANHTSDVRTYTGCVTTSSGTISKVQWGNEPKQPCASTERLIHLSGGDITGVQPAPDGGLRGGASSGVARLGVDFANLDGRYVNEADAGTPISWRGVWNATTNYAAGDVVTRAGSSYAATVPNVNMAPPSGQTWQLLARKGDQGVQGIQGETGPAGPTGPQGPGAKTMAGTFETSTCAELDDLPWTSVRNDDGSCAITIPGGAVDGWGLPIVERATLEAFALNGDGSGWLQVRGQGTYIFVLYTTSGQPLPVAPAGSPASAGDTRSSTTP
jgi:hypothetical protein